MPSYINNFASTNDDGTIPRMRIATVEKSCTVRRGVGLEGKYGVSASVFVLPTFPFAFAARSIARIVIGCSIGAGVSARFGEQTAFPTTSCGGALDEALTPNIPTYSACRGITGTICAMLVISTSDPKEYSKQVGVTYSAISLLVKTRKRNRSLTSIVGQVEEKLLILAYLRLVTF